MLIEVDHMSELARDRVLRIAARHRYPRGLGPHRHRRRLDAEGAAQLYRNGGLALGDPRPGAAARRQDPRLPPYASPKHYFGVGLGTDTGGFSSLPGPRDDAAQNPLAYPFESYDGRSRFTRQHTGERFFDLNTDGVAHYGPLRRPPSRTCSAARTASGWPCARSCRLGVEAYLQMWALGYSPAASRASARSVNSSTRTTLPSRRV